MNKYRSYKQTLQNTLKDPKEAVAYLNAALEENDHPAFIMALKDVAEVHGNPHNGYLISGNGDFGTRR
jgi:DNA-binding phage protein